MSGEWQDRLFFLKYRLYRGRVGGRYKELLRSQYAGRDELEELNWGKRRELLKSSYEKVPYYREKYQKVGLEPGDIKKREEWERMPVLKKDEIRDHFRELLARDGEKRFLIESTTGGSTGEPLKVLFDKRIPQEAYGWRMMKWWGIEPGGDAAYVWRRRRENWGRRKINEMLWWPTRRMELDASCMTEEKMRDFVGRFNRIGPALLQGYVGAIDHLASYIEDEQLKIQPPKAIWVTSSPVSSVQRKRIERIFEAPVYDQYGCGEMFWLAAQCGERGGLHINYEGRYIEFVEENGRGCEEGQYGRILITDLDNRLFPLIRYENGDRGRSLAGQCGCGVTLPMMGQVRGRMTEMIRLPDRSCISGDYLTTIFDAYPEVVKSFQVRQEADYSIRLLYVPQGKGAELQRVMGKVNEEVVKRTREQVPVRLEEVEEIPHREGKLLYVSSAIGQDKEKKSEALISKS